MRHSVRWKSWLIGGMLFGTMAYAIAEDLTLTTYYPSPRGVYDQLIVNTLTLGNPGDLTVPGTLTVNDNTTLGDAATDLVTFNAASLAIPNTLNIGANTVFIDAASGNVGIGTVTPQSPAPNGQPYNLQVNDIYLTSYSKWLSQLMLNKTVALNVGPISSACGSSAPVDAPVVSIPALRCFTAIQVTLQMDAARCDGDGLHMKHFRLSVDGDTGPNQILRFGSDKTGSSGHFWGYRSSVSKTFYITDYWTPHTITGSVFTYPVSGDQVNILNAYYHVTCL